jgi:hypothetical protein
MCSDAESAASGRLRHGKPNGVSNAIGYAKFYSRSHDAVIRVYDEAGNVIETNLTEKLLHLEIGCAFSLQAPRYCGSLSVISSQGARSSTKV